MAFLNRFPDYTLPALLSLGTVGLVLLSRRTTRPEKDRPIFPTGTSFDDPLGTGTTPGTTTPPAQSRYVRVAPMTGIFIYETPDTQGRTATMSGPRTLEIMVRGAEWSYARVVPNAGDSVAAIPWTSFWVRSTDLAQTTPTTAPAAVTTTAPRCPPGAIEIPRGDPRATQGKNAALPFLSDGAGNFWKCMPGVAAPGGTF